MKLLILGATGPTGQELVRQALVDGHQVTALVRNAAKLAIKNAHLFIQTGDILNEAELTQVIRGQEAVLSALGSGRNLHSDIISREMPILIRSMENAKVKRLIFLSSFGVGETRKEAPFFSRVVFRLLLNFILKDKGKADRLLRSSGLDYTLVYPTSLTNGSNTGKYRVGEDLRLPAFPKISRADVAGFMLSQLIDLSWIRKTAIISY